MDGVLPKPQPRLVTAQFSVVFIYLSDFQPFSYLLNKTEYESSQGLENVSGGLFFQCWRHRMTWHINKVGKKENKRRQRLTLIEVLELADIDFNYDQYIEEKRGNERINGWKDEKH